MENERFTFFWDGPFSQWHPSPFEIDGILYKSAEIYMMWAKDRLFSGGLLSHKILNAKHPADAKLLGREVINFDPEIWNRIARDIVLVGSIAKFTQNPDLCEALMETEGTTLVEASPRDTIWGIGLSERDQRAQQRSTWLGTNWLGEVLTKARNIISLAQRSRRLD